MPLRSGSGVGGAIDVAAIQVPPGGAAQCARLGRRTLRRLPPVRKDLDGGRSRGLHLHMTFNASEWTSKIKSGNTCVRGGCGRVSGAGGAAGMPGDRERWVRRRGGSGSSVRKALEGCLRVACSSMHPKSTRPWSSGTASAAVLTRLACSRGRVGKIPSSSAQHCRPLGCAQRPLLPNRQSARQCDQ